MQKAFIFDLDGVLINDEEIWEEKKQTLYGQLFGVEIHEKLGSTLGINMDGIYEKAVSLGAKVDKQKLLGAFYRLADDIYSSAPIPEGVDELIKELSLLDYHIGIVSASPLSWIIAVLERLSYKDSFELIISLHERPDLKHKPEPDGYIEAMRALRASPETTVVLEDSNSGIKSAKASGAYTIGLKQNLVNGYEQVGADDYADNMLDVAKLVKKKSLSLA